MKYRTVFEAAFRQAGFECGLDFIDFRRVGGGHKNLLLEEVHALAIIAEADGEGA